MAFNERLGLGSAGGAATQTSPSETAGGVMTAQSLNYQIQYNDPNNYAGTLSSAIRADMNAALQNFEGTIHGAGTLVVQLNIVASSTSNAGELADGGPSALMPTGTLDGRTLETPAALYELRTGSHLPGFSSDIVVNVPSSALGELYFDPNPAAGDSIASVAPSEYDGITVFRHELTHGLGFISLRDTSTGVLGPMETAFDHYSSITSTGADYFMGPNAEAVYGAAVPLTTIKNGEQYSHLGNSLSGPLASDLMSGTGIQNGVTHQVSALDFAILHDIGVPVSGGLPCFAAGTRISTMNGAVPVEDLRTGDALLLQDGATAAITWIGSRRIDIASHPDPAQVAPVLLRKDAIGEAAPARDLLVSPDHAIWFGGTLIPAKALLNGVTIRQVHPNMITYFHIELASHAVILAEGLPVESYLDTGNRRVFSEARIDPVLHPVAADDGQMRRERLGCAPFAETGPLVATLRTLILERAAIAMMENPDLTVRLGDAALQASWPSPDMLEVTLPKGGPEGTGDLVIASRNFVPAEMTPDPRDRRRLGIAVSSLEIHRDDAWRHISLDDAALSQGWHAMEPGYRWTNGRGIVPARSLAGATRLRMRFKPARYGLTA